MEKNDILQANSRKLLRYFQEECYAEARRAKQEGRLVCWSTSIAPPDFCVAMDIAMIYPENHSAAIGARKGALDMLAITDKKGYSQDICSYARVNLGYLELLIQESKTGERPLDLTNCPAEYIPLPDLVIACNNICNTVFKWYENIAFELKIPFIVIDMPFNHVMPVPQHSQEYIAAQIEYSIQQLEAITGRPFNYEKLKLVQEQSQRSVREWGRIAGVAGMKPSPLNGFDLFNYMALIVCARALDYSEITFKKFVDELEANAGIQKYAFGDNELVRVAWEGIAVWPHLNHTYATLAKYGALMVGSTYPEAWTIKYEPGNYQSLAEAYSKIPTNVDFLNRVGAIGRVVESTKSEAVIFHLNRSCKNMCMLNYEAIDYIQNKYKIPGISFDGDQTDPRNFSSAQYDTRIQAMVEVALKNKED